MLRSAMAYPFALPELPYADDALEPAIDRQTMIIHRTKHHQAYVTNLNKALEGHPDLHALSICEICARVSSLPESIRGVVRNNGGGHWNHSAFWTMLAAPGNGTAPSAALASAIDAHLGGMEEFKKSFAAAAAGRFGSGWAWLILTKEGKLAVTSTPNQDNPLMTGVADACGKPLLGLDVWEHAYYLHYQNRRPDYVTAFWSVVNWDEVSRRFASAG